MKRFIIPIILALAAASASAADCNWSMKNDDLRYRQDKKWHFEKTAIGTFALKGLNEATGFGASNWQIFWTGVLPGFVHELGTACDGNRHVSQRAFSHQDMVYNMLGSAAGVALGEGAVVLLRRNGVDIFIEWD